MPALRIARQIYYEIVCTTLETGRELTVGSLACLWKSCIRMMPLPSLSSFFIVTSITCCGLRALKSNESRSQENIAIFLVPRYVTISGGCCSAGKRKNGEGEAPKAH